MLGRQRFFVELVVADYVDSFTFGKELRLFAFVALAENTVGELQDRAAQQRGTGLNQDLIVVAGRGLVAASGFNHGQNALVVLFQLAVSEAKGAKQLDAANLKPDQVVGIVEMPI